MQLTALCVSRFNPGKEGGGKTVSVPESFSSQFHSQVLPNAGIAVAAAQLLICFSDVSGVFFSQ